MQKALLILLLAAVSMIAGDVTGRWTGTFRPDEAPEDGPALLILKQDGEKITGSAGPTDDERFDIEEGKIADGKITFSVRGGSMKFALKVEENQISGDVTRERDGQVQKAKLNVKREKTP